MELNDVIVNALLSADVVGCRAAYAHQRRTLRLSVRLQQPVLVVNGNAWRWQSLLCSRRTWRRCVRRSRYCEMVDTFIADTQQHQLYVTWSDVTYLWSQCNRHSVGQHVVLCVVKWWRFVALFESNWISVGLRKCPYYRYLIEKVTSTDVRTTNISQSLPHKMAESSWYEEITSLSPYAMHRDYYTSIWRLVQWPLSGEVLRFVHPRHCTKC